MTAEKVSLTDSSENLNSDELKAINKKLDESIKSKKDGGMIGFSPSTEDSNKNSFLDLSSFRLGLNTPNDVKEFLLSSSGKKAIHEILVEEAHQETIKEEKKLQIQEQLMKEEQIKFLLFRMLLEDETESKKAQDELIALQQEEKIKAESNAQKKTKANEPKKDAQDPLEPYDKSIKKLDDDKKDLEQRAKKLKEERGLLTAKYDTYDKDTKEFYNANFDEKSIETIKADIAVLEKQQDTIAEKMMNATDDNEAHALANDLNSMNQKIINLKEIVAVKEGGKKFIDADGNSEDKNGNPINFKNAAFVVAKDQNIAKDEEGSYYLLKDKQKFDDMSPEEKKTAQEDFKRAKMDIKVVKDVVEDVKTEELDFNTTRMAQNKVEQSLVQKQLDLQHEARRDAEKNLAQKKDQPAKSEPAKSEPAKSEPKSTPKEKNPYLALNDQMAQVVAEIQGIINDGLKDLAKAGFDKAKQTAIGQSLGRLSDAITQKGDELKQELMDKVGEKLDDLKNSKQGQAVGALKDTLGSVKDAISRGLVSGIDKIIDKVKDIGSDENPDNSIELSSPANSITSLISRAKNWFDSIDFEKLAKEPESTPKPTESPSLEEESTSTMKTR